MNYELAKKLKDAGFPQVGGETISCEKGCTLEKIVAEGREAHNVAIIPTLEELIDACGEIRVEKLKMHFSLTYWPANKNWYAEQMGRQEISKTPSEAVANLYIALNKK